MPYRRTRSQSAEFLRLAVGYMGRQEACLDPASYTLWYEHAAGLNPPLSEVLEGCLQTQTPLTDADVARLYSDHIASRDVQAVVRIREKLESLLRDASRVIDQSGTHAMEFGRSLREHSEQLDQLGASGAIHAVLGDLIAETQKMAAATHTLARQLEARAREVDGLQHRLHQAETAALNDPLTGLLNRRGFEQAFAQLGPAQGFQEGVSILVVDVDRFKEVNDAHGHAVGDQVLRGVAQVLRARIKGADMACRIGGDEFAVILPNTARSGAVSLAEQIRGVLANSRLRRIASDQEIGQVTVSIGVAHGVVGTALDVLMQAADAALYDAKRDGRDRVVSAG